MAIDVARVRAETPGCEHLIHLNNAGAALAPAAVTETVVDHLELEQRLGGYEAADAAADRTDAVYASIASLLGCAPDEVALVENATRGWDLAFYAIPFRPGDRILTGMAEYASNFIAYLQIARRHRVEVVPIDNDEHGQIDVSALAVAVDERTRLISLTHVPTNGGLVNPATEVGRVAVAAGVPYLLDACQSAGQLSLDVDEIGCDMLAATGRKYLRGPRGTGFLYVRRNLLEKLEPPLLDLRAATWEEPGAYRLRDDARRFETWESNVAGRLGLGAAVDYALAVGLEAIEARVADLADDLRARLATIPGVEVRDLGRRRCGIVSFTTPADPVSLRDRLRAEGVNVSVTTAASTLLDMRSRGLDAMVRASVHYYNTDDELARFHHLLAGLL